MNRSWMLLLLLPALATPVSAATIAVTTTADDVTVNGNCTLREAVEAAETDAAVDGCPAGSPAATDLVTLPEGDHQLALGEILVGTTPGPLVLRGPSGPPGASISPAFADPERLFNVGPNADFALERLALRFGETTDQGGAVRAFNASMAARDVAFVGNAAKRGGALYYFAIGAYTLTLERCRFETNEATSSSGDGEGGGAWVTLSNGAAGRIVDSVFVDNLGAAAPGGLGGEGGGLHASVGGSSSLDVVRSRFELNRVDPQPVGGGSGSGAYLVAGGMGARLTVVDSVFSRNDVIQPSIGELTGAISGFAAGGASLVLDRIRLEDNDPGEPGRHLVLWTFQDGTVSATNLVLANGPETGLQVICADAPCTIGHATIFGHSVRAAWFVAEGAGEIRLDNSILYQSHGVAMDGPVVVDPSTFASGADPLFVEPLAGDFTLQPLSPAIDFGDATLASVRSLDAAHAPRIVGMDTDAGAYERGGIFGDGFETGDAGAWTAEVP